MVDDVIQNVRQPDEIIDQVTACRSYARGLAGAFFHQLAAAVEAEKAKCDEFNFEVDPKDLYMARLETFREEAARYCPGLNGEISSQATEERVRKILDSLPADERKQVEDGWLDSGGRL